MAAVYNLALCQHLRAVTPGINKGSAVRLLQRAVALYCHAASLLTSVSNEEEDSPMLLFTIVICNNLGHANSGALCSPEKARQSFRQLTVVIANYFAEEDEELDVGFISNAISLVLMSTNTAAGAAFLFLYGRALIDS
jgi:hypothetical protein